TATQLGDLVAAARTGVPFVAMTAPASGSSFNAASNIVLSASVTTNGNHTVDRVQFYDTHSTLLGEAIASPYKYSWTGMQAGNYPLFSPAAYDGSRFGDFPTGRGNRTQSGTWPANRTGGGPTTPRPQ